MELHKPPIPFDFYREDMKIYAVMLACSIVANDNGLTPKQQIEIYNPAHWNDSPGQKLDKEFEAFKRCGSQGFISITEKFDHELANKGWYSKHLTFKNKKIIIDPDHIGFTSNNYRRGYKKCR